MFNFLNRMIPALAAIMLLAAGPGAEAAPLKVGAAANVGGLIVFVAQDKGIFAKHGIDAKVITRNTGAQLTKSLRAGEIDFAPAAFTNLPAALDRGLKLRGVVGYTGGSYSKSTSDNFVGIAARPGSGVSKIADLKGKKIGVTFGSTGDLYLRTLLRKNGLGTGDIKRINVRPPSLVSVFDTGGVEAIVAWEPFLTRLLDKVSGSKLVVRGGGHVCFCAVLHGTPEKVYADRKMTQSFVDAMSESAAYVRDPANLEEVAVIGSRFVRGMPPELVKRTMPHMVYDTRLGQNTYAAFNFSVKQLIAQKKMKRPYDPANYLDLSFINSTMKRHPEWFKDLPPGK